MASSVNKVVIVTGAGTGIGQATAVEFTKKGCNVVVTGRRKEKLEATVSLCEAEGATKDRVLPLQADVRLPEDNERVIQKTLETFARLNCLVNNAGIGSGRSFEMTTLDHLDSLYQVHVRGVFDLTQKAMPHPLKTKGNVVTVSSVSALMAITSSLGYSMMKACVDHFTRALSVDYAAREVRLNTVNPGYVQTHILDRGHPGKTPDEIKEVFKQCARAQPNGICQEPEDVAKVIVFLASDDASFINGGNIPVDGGWRNALADCSK